MGNCDLALCVAGRLDHVVAGACVRRADHERGGACDAGMDVLKEAEPPLPDGADILTKRHEPLYRHDSPPDFRAFSRCSDYGGSEWVAGIWLYVDDLSVG